MTKNYSALEESVCRFYLDNKTDCDIHYNAAESSSISTLYETITDNALINELLSHVSLVVLTANKYEKNVFHHNIFLDIRQKLKKFKIVLFPHQESKQETYGYVVEWQNHTVLHIEAQVTGSYTIGGSADIVRYIINNDYISPVAIVSLGICFGTNEKENSLGDVIISQKIYPYFIGSKIKETSFVVSDDNMFRTNSNILASIKNIMDENSFAGYQSNVLLGNYITGEAVVSNKKVRDEFVRTTTQKIIAGEMEGYGLYKECNTNHALPCVIIKSICDWAAAKNFDSKSVFEKICTSKNCVGEHERSTLKERIQAFAAFQSYNVLKTLVLKQVFLISLYDEFLKHLTNIHDRVLLGNRIKTELLEVASKRANGLSVSDKFVLSIIKSLVHNNIINCSELNINNCVEGGLYEQIWKHSFVISTEVKKCLKQKLGIN